MGKGSIDLRMAWLVGNSQRVMDHMSVTHWDHWGLGSMCQGDPFCCLIAVGWLWGILVLFFRNGFDLG